MSETPEESVTRLIDERDADEEEIPEIAELPTTGEFHLSEHEHLILENLELKQEVYRQKIAALEYEMTGLVERVRQRLQVPEDAGLQFNRDMLTVKVFKE